MNVFPIPFKAQRRFWKHVYTPVYLGECWLWKDAVDADGYGRFTFQRRMVKAHQFAYRLFVGPVPEGRELHHECQSQSCVNPDHLKAVTRKEHNRVTKSNLRRDKSRCKHGHLLTPGNIYTNPRGHRTCRACNHIQKRAWDEAKAAQAKAQKQAQIQEVV